MKQKLFITGAQGFLGCRLVEHYSSTFDVTACGRKDLDLTNAQQVADALGQAKPDAVVHCAAISSTGYSQEHPQESLLVNKEVPVLLAKICGEMRIKLISMSSDQVYNKVTEKGLLSEETLLPEPGNYYGQHKLQSEQAIQEVNPDAVCLRLSWMYDKPESTLRTNGHLLLNLLNACKEQKTLNPATHEFRGITYVWDVVRNMQKCITLPGGVYNYGSENTINSYETFLIAARSLHLPDPERWILPNDQWVRNLSMDISKIRQYGIDFESTTQRFESLY